MDYKIEEGKLTIIAFDEERKELQQMKEEGENLGSDRAMYEFLEPLICNSELQWIDPYVIGEDITDAPMLAILGDEQICPKNDNGRMGFIRCGQGMHKGEIRVFCQPVLSRWAFKDYQVRSLLEELMENGKVVLIGGDLIEGTPEE